MGEYKRLNNMIEQHKEMIDDLNHKLDSTTKEDEREGILEEIYELQIEVGEIEGALLEMAEIDGLDDPYEAFDH